MTGRHPLIIIGSGGHALVIWEILEQVGNVEVMGFTDPSTPSGTMKQLGSLSKPVLGGDDVLIEQLKTNPRLYGIAGVGPEPYAVRHAALDLLDTYGQERVFTAVHPRAVVSPAARLGAGSVVMAGAVVNPGVVMGRHCVINTGATVDHECQLSDNVFIQPGVHLGGRVVVGENAIVGIGASVRERIRIGRHAYVGGGAFVNHDVPPHAVVIGVPAKFLRDRSKECEVERIVHRTVSR